MLRPTAINVFPLDDYKLKILFDNNEIKIFDVKPYIKGNWYSELSNLNYFHSVFTNGYTIEWANGQDICPDELYYNSVLWNETDEAMKELEDGNGEVFEGSTSDFLKMMLEE